MADRKFRIGSDRIAAHNRAGAKALDEDFRALARALKRRGVDVEAVMRRLAAFQVAVPSWGTRSGGTRFGTFDIPGLPRDIFEKLDDAATVHALTGATPKVSLHLPWDHTDDPATLKRYARKLGLGFDAMNSNTFQDQPGQVVSFRHGSLAAAGRDAREQAIAHNLAVIEAGRALGSKAITVWIGDGANAPGQMDLTASFERYAASLKKVHAALPPDWTMFIEYKPFEPAFYYTVLADWGSALMASQEAGPRCRVLVDLGHHLPGTNIEAIVARLIRAGRLGGFHLNDNAYADDDLTAASIAPYRLFRIFHELVLAGGREKRFKPAYMIDQSHNFQDPLEGLLQTVMEMQAIWAKALLVDHARLAEYQDADDAVAAEMTLKDAFHTDTRPLAAMARVVAGGAADPVAAYRASGYRVAKARERG